MRFCVLTLLLLLSFSISLPAQRAVEDLPLPSTSLIFKATDTTWLPAWMMVEDYNPFVVGWDTTELHNYTYNGAGFEETDSVDQWAFGIWNPTTKWEYTTDSKGEVLWTTRLIRVAGAWQYDYSLRWSNDSLGNRLGFLWLDWNVAAGAWDTMLVRRFLNTYDGSGHLLEQINQVNSGSGWNNSSKSIWAFDVAGLDSLEETYSWSSSMWMPNNQYIRFFNTSGEMTEQFRSTGSGTSWVPADHEYGFTWHNYAKYQYLTRTVAVWSGSAYEDIERYTVTYGINDSYVSLMESYGSSGWQPSIQLILNYDADGRQELYEQSSWTGSAYVPSIGVKHLFTYGSGGELLVDEYQLLSGSAYMPQARSTYGNHSVDAHAPNPEPALWIWPNPALDQLHLSLPNGKWELRLLSLEGKEVFLPLSQQEGFVELPLKDLRAGTYLLHAQQGEQIITRKVMVQ
jgi:hypothetical protein